MVVRIESLALFLSVVAEGSITRAARSSYISQQGASAIIKSLEHEFGVTLFERRGASLQLTEAGARIAAEAESVVSAYRKLQTVAALSEGSRPDDGGPARIVTTPHALNVLSPIFDAYREVQGEKDPFILVEESIFDIVGAFPDLDPNALYVVNVPTFMETIIERLGSSFEPLVVCELMLYCRSDSPFADRGMISRDELSEMNIACYNEALLIRLVQHLLKGVEGADIAMRTSNLSLLNRMISEPRTVTFIDSLSLFLNGVPDGDSCIPIENPVSFATGFLGPVRGPAAERFAAFFRRYLETVCSDYQKRFVLTWPPPRTQESAS
ncbi:LysR family transcriptional regulator [Eggerthella sp. YY7918]|uniref:LysR family transcriptional regulator n=1 Tax=Eggerthella sp. (strain YY7918) TaxID=502558 RepID=UPI000217170B|nr:LysR family transcriptional regulator [Eggerthella sp. YY7918]BAK44477.1 transcriptional regulator [Eggerthella sp. YY7918]